MNQDQRIQVAAILTSNVGKNPDQRVLDFISTLQLLTEREQDIQRALKGKLV